MRPATRTAITVFLILLLVHISVAYPVNLSLNESVLNNSEAETKVNTSIPNDNELTPEINLPVQNESTPVPETQEIAPSETAGTTEVPEPPTEARPIASPRSVTYKDGTELNIKDSKSIEIKTKDYTLNVDSTSTLFEVDDISRTKEWGYHSAGHDTVESDSELEILNEDYVCIRDKTVRERVAKVEGGRISLVRESNPACLHYPKKLVKTARDEGDLYENLVKIRQTGPNTVRVDYPFDNYDPQLVNYTGDCNSGECQVIAGKYRADLVNGSIQDFFCTASDQPSLDWCTGGQTAGCGTIYSNTSSWVLDYGNETDCSVTSYADYIRMNCSNANAENNWYFYDTYIRLESTARTYYRVYWFNPLMARNSSVYTDSGSLVPRTRFWDADGPNGMAGIAANTSIASPEVSTSYMLGFIWNESMGTDFDYGAGVDYAGMAWWRYSEQPPNTITKLWMKCLQRNDSQATMDSKYTTVLNSFKADVRYGDSSSPPTVSSIYVTSSNPSNNTDADWTGRWTATDPDGTVYNTTWFNTSTKKPLLIYDFNNGYATDLSGNGNDGVVYSNAGVGTDSDGSIALNFDGDSDYVELGDTDFFYNKDFTISACYYLNDSTSSENALLYENAGMYLAVGIAGDIRFQDRVGYTDCKTNSDPVVSNAWQCMVMTYDNVKGCQFYVDGVNRTSDTTVTMVDTSSPLQVSRNSVTTAFQGRIGDFRIYNYAMPPALALNLSQRKTNLLTSDSTTTGETWQFNVISSDSTSYSNQGSARFTILSGGSSSSTDYSYDAAGNLMDDGAFYYEYNNYNQLYQIRVDNSSGTIFERYYYDENGQRVIKIHFNTDGTNETVFYVGGDYVSVKRGSTLNNTVYYYHGDKLVAERKNDSTMLFYHPDHLGSTTLVTNSLGQVYTNLYYTPFGEALSNPKALIKLYEGKYLDYSGLLYYGARYYCYNTLKFIQPDIFTQDIYDPQTLNHYTFKLNNPYKYIDPTGRKVKYYSVVPKREIYTFKGKSGINYQMEKVIGYEISYRTEKTSRKISMAASTYEKLAELSDRQSSTPYSGLSSIFGRNMKEEYMVSYLEKARGESYEPRGWIQRTAQSKVFQTALSVGGLIGASLLGGPEVGLLTGAATSAPFANADLAEKEAEKGDVSMGDIAIAYGDVVVGTFGGEVLEGTVSSLAKTSTDSIVVDIASDIGADVIWQTISSETN